MEKPLVVIVSPTSRSYYEVAASFWIVALVFAAAGVLLENNVLVVVALALGILAALFTVVMVPAARREAGASAELRRLRGLVMDYRGGTLYLGDSVEGFVPGYIYMFATLTVLPHGTGGPSAMVHSFFIPVGEPVRGARRLSYGFAYPRGYYVIVGGDSMGSAMLPAYCRGKVCIAVADPGLHGAEAAAYLSDPGSGATLRLRILPGCRVEGELRAPCDAAAYLVYRWRDVEVGVRLAETRGGGVNVFRKKLCLGRPAVLLINLDNTDLDHIPLHLVNKRKAALGHPWGEAGLEAQLRVRGRLGRVKTVSRTMA